MKNSIAVLLFALSTAVGAAPPPDLSPVPARPTPSTLSPGWTHGAFMEVFVRAYQDSNGDGIGDLRGLTSRLDYLQELGVKGLWLMPITASADHDHGYATMDYRGLEPAYGTLADLDELLTQAHRRGIGIIIDYVINHSARAHPLFQLSASGQDSPLRDWYVWQDPAPTGWDIWGKNPWTTTPTGTFFATFGPHMPDFNLRNPAVVEYHESSLRFWLNRGLDGFRLDAVPHLIENDAEHWDDQPESRQLVKELQNLVKAYPNRHVVCEATASPEAYADPAVCGSAFAFGLEGFIIKAAQGQADAVPKVADYFKTAPLTMATMLSNHDIFAGQRVWDQMKGDEAEYKLAAATYLLLPGTPFIYYGEEMGLAGLQGQGAQDGDGPIRAPVSWGRDGHGFSTGTPFRGFSPNAATHNPEVERSDPASLLNFYKAMLKLRNQRPSIAEGSYEAAAAEGQVLSFQRHLGAELSLVVINYGKTEKTVELKDLPAGAVLTADYPHTLAPLPTDAAGHLRLTLPPQAVIVLGAAL